MSELSVNVLISKWFSVHSQSAYSTWQFVITTLSCILLHTLFLFIKFSYSYALHSLYLIPDIPFAILPFLTFYIMSL